MVDSERGVGRPDRALELGRSVDRSKLERGTRAELAIAMSGAQLDLGHADRALLELDIPELDPDVAFAWSPGLFAARATVLEELGRDEEAQLWRKRAEIAAEALGDGDDGYDDEVVFIDEIDEEAEPEQDEAAHDSAADSASEHDDAHVVETEARNAGEDVEVERSDEAETAAPIGIEAQIAAEFAEIEAEIAAAPDVDAGEAEASTVDATGEPAEERGE